MIFARLTDLRFKRSATQALGFYLAYLFLGILVGFLSGAVAGMLGLIENYSSGVDAGALAVIPFCIALSITIGVKKGISLEFKMLVLYMITGICAVFSGALLGLVIPAYLTTFDSVKTSH